MKSSSTSPASARMGAIAVMTSDSNQPDQSPSAVRDLIWRHLEAEGLSVHSVRVLTDFSDGFTRHPLTAESAIINLIRNCNLLIETLYPRVRSDISHDTLGTACQRLVKNLRYIVKDETASRGQQHAGQDQSIEEDIGRVSHAIEQLIRSIETGKLRRPLR